jgi:acyl-CoA dehydrogenase
VSWATPERQALRHLVRDFTAHEVVPHLAAWERANDVPRSLHLAAAKAGILGIGFPESVGGSGGDGIDAAIVTEELIGSGGSGGLHSALFTHGIALGHLVAAGDPRQVERWVRPVLAGERIAALAVTEPGGGSDVAGITTRAVRDGDDWVIDGAKTFITSGARADQVTVAVRSGDPGHHGLSLVVVEAGTPGFTVGRRLAKMGWHCSDTAELAFDGVRVPADHLIGEEGTGFLQIVRQFETERLGLAVMAYATAQRCLDLTVRWVQERETFGRPLSSRQVVRHRVVEMARQVDVARTYVRSVLERHVAGESVLAEVAMAKNTAVACVEHVADEAVQLHGGMGYMAESEVERHFRDMRILGIGGGTTEIMNEVVAKLIGL